MKTIRKTPVVYKLEFDAKSRRRAKKGYNSYFSEKAQDEKKT